MPLNVSSTCAHHQEVKIALHSLWFIQSLCIKLVKYWDKYTDMHGQQNDKYTEMHGQQNDKYTEMHGQQNDKYTEMHGQQNVESPENVNWN